MQPPIIHKAPWILCTGRECIADGGLVLQENTIAALGPVRTLQQRYPGAPVVDHPRTVLMPGLINGHIHVELSHLAHLAQDTPAESFTSWLTDMLAEREALGFVGPEVESAAANVLQRQYESGVIALADIGNTDLACRLAATFPGHLFPFVEYFGLGRVSLASALKKLEQQGDGVACTAHAPYSTHPHLIQALHDRAQKLGFFFPIHVAEPLSERSMLCRGEGALADFLRGRGFYDDDFRPAGIDIVGSVQYLHALGVLTENTICVHCIHVDDTEIDLLQSSRAGICLCPGSNRFLQTGKAPVPTFLKHGILPALGTDSAASNPELSLWTEMRILSEDHPAIAFEDIVSMATLGGAEALGMASEYGTLAIGKKGPVLAVEMPGKEESEKDVLSSLVLEGHAMNKYWISA